MAHINEESGTGRKRYPVGSPEWIREQKELMDQRNRQRMLEQQRREAKEKRLFQQEKIPLPSGDTGTRNPSIDQSQTISQAQSIAGQADAISKAGASNRKQRNELTQVLNFWRKLGGDYTDHIKAGGYDVLLMDGKYHATKDGQDKMFNTSRDLINYIYGEPKKSIYLQTNSFTTNEKDSEFTMGPTDEDARFYGLELKSGNLTYENLDELNSPMIINSSYGPAFSYMPNSIFDENSEEWTNKINPPPVGDTEFNWANFMATGFDKEGLPATSKGEAVEGFASALATGLYAWASSYEGLKYKVKIQENSNNDQRLIITGGYRVQRGDETGDMYANRPGTLIEALHLFWDKAEDEHTLDNANGMISWTDLLNSYFVDVNTAEPEEEIIKQMSIPDRIITEKALDLSDLMTNEDGDALKVYISFDKERLTDTDTFYCYIDENGDAYAQLRLLPGERIYANTTIQKDSPWRAPWEKSNMQLQDITEFFLEPYPLNDAEEAYLKSCMEQAFTTKP